MVFFELKENLWEIYTKLADNPLFVLKPKSTFLEKDPLYFELFLLIFFMIFFYYKTRSTGDCCFVNRGWSILPIIYSLSMSLHYIYHNKSFHGRLNLVFILTFSWGIRLSYNLYSKGI